MKEGLARKKKEPPGKAALDSLAGGSGRLAGGAPAGAPLQADVAGQANAAAGAWYDRKRQETSMPRITKVYTHTGDEGVTSLGGGQRVPKDAARVAAYGAVDELNSAIGVALARGVAARLAAPLAEVQNDLFHLGSDLCFVEADKAARQLPQLEARHVEALEALIDELNASLGPLKNFVLPGGAGAAADLHLARAICRRAEREVASLAAQEAIGPCVIPYLNRLSDALFVMARFENRERGGAEALWNSRA
jgi:cob(I)alamin adenosyltransferase